MAAAQQSCHQLAPALARGRFRVLSGAWKHFQSDALHLRHAGNGWEHGLGDDVHVQRPTRRVNSLDFLTIRPRSQAGSTAATVDGPAARDDAPHGSRHMAVGQAIRGKRQTLPRCHSLIAGLILHIHTQGRCCIAVCDF